MELLDQPTQPERRPEMPLRQVLLINLGIMLAYMGLTFVSNISDAESSLFIDAFLIMAQVGINLLLGFILVFMASTRYLGAAMLISGFLIGLIGFGTCMGKAALLG
jgi:hypothetical protein